MILQIAAHIRRFDQRLYAEFAQQPAGADPRKLQQLRGIHRSAAKQDLPPSAGCENFISSGIGDARGSSAFEIYPDRVRLKHDSQIGSPYRGPDIASRRRGPAPSGGRKLIVENAERLLGVVILESFVSQLRRGPEIRSAKFVGAVRNAFDRERPRIAAPSVFPSRPALDPLEDGLDVFPSPTDRAGIRPVVEVAGAAARVHHAIDGTGAAQDFSARPIDPPSVELRLRLREIFPVHAFIEIAPSVADRHLHPKRAVRTSRLKRQDLISPAFAQSIRQYRARGPHADYDEIVFVHGSRQSSRSTDSAHSRI